MTRALLHIGTEKTGTSTLQAFLQQNRALLRQHGIAYLRSPGARNHRLLAAYAMKDARSDDLLRQWPWRQPLFRRLWRIAFRIQLGREIAQLKRQGVHTFLFSSEHCHSRLKSLEEITRLADLLNPHFQQVDVLVYLRRQDQVATSLYSTALKAGRAIPFEPFFRHRARPDDPYLNYATLLEHWATVFGKSRIKPRIFSRQRLLHGDLLADFCDASGVIDTRWPLTIPANENEGVSATAQTAAQLFNSEKADQPRNRQHKQQVQALIDQLNQAFPGPSVKPGRELARSFYQVFAASNQQLAQTWFDGSPPFDEDFSGYPMQADTLELAPEHQAAVRAAITATTAAPASATRRLFPRWWQRLRRR